MHLKCIIRQDDKKGVVQQEYFHPDTSVSALLQGAHAFWKVKIRPL